MSRRSPALKAVSLALAACFLASDVLAAAPIEPSATPLSRIEAIALDPVRFEAPEEFALLKEIHRGSDGIFIIHIQDAHANLSGQENMAAALDRIMEKYEVSLVLVEGGSKDDTLTPIKSVAPPEVWRRVAKSFLIEGKISGDEYLNLISDHPMKIVGIEDPELYMRSVREYASLAALREETVSYLRSIRAALEKLKRRSYSDSLLQYERTRAARADGGSAYRDLVQLAERSGVALEAYPDLARLRRLDVDERRIDFESASLEQAALAAEIVRRGGGKELERSLAAGGLSRERTTAQYTHFQNTFHIAREKGVRLEDYPALLAYVEYLRDFCEIDLDAAVRQSARVEDEIYRKLLSGDDPRILRAIDRYLELLLTAYNIQMSTHDFRMFQANEPDFATARYLAFLNRKLAEAGYVEDLIPYKDALERGKEVLESFYDSVSQRDFAFVRNAERILKEERQKVAVLISGGYHTPHLKKLFRDKGYSYAVLTPIVTAPTNQAKYERLLLEPLKKAKSAPDRAAAEPSDLEKDLLALRKNSDGVSIQKTGEPQSGARLAELVEAAARLSSKDEGEAQEKAAKATLGFYARGRDAAPAVQQALSTSERPTSARLASGITDLMGDEKAPETWSIMTLESVVTPQRFDEADTALPSGSPRLLAAGASLRDVRFLAERYPKAEITVVDTNLEVLERLSENLAKDAVLAGRVRLFRADASKLRTYTDERGAAVFPDASFDLFYAVGINASAFLDDAAAEPVLTAMAEEEVRLVRPGGLIYHPQTARHYDGALEAGLIRPLDPVRPYFYRRSAPTVGARLSQYLKHPLLASAALLHRWIGGWAALSYLPSLRDYLRLAAPRLSVISQAGDALRFHAIAYDRIASHEPSREEAALGEGPVSIARSKETIYRRPRIGEDGTILVAEQHAVIVPAEDLRPGRTMLTSHVKTCSAAVAELLGRDGKTYYLMAHQYPQSFGRIAARAIEDLFRSGFIRKASVRAFSYEDRVSVEAALAALRETARAIDPGNELEYTVEDHRYGAALTLTSTREGVTAHLWSSSRIFPMDYERVDFSRTRPRIVLELPTAGGPSGARLAVASIKSVRELTRQAEVSTAATGLYELDLEGPVLPAEGVGRLVDEVKRGRLVIINLSRFEDPKHDEKRTYQEVNLALLDIAHDLDDAFGARGQVLGFAIGEALRNAVLHGNALNLRLPVLLRLELQGDNAKSVHVFDTAASTDSRARAAVPEAVRAAGEALGGTGSGLDALQDHFTYERRYVREGKLGTIGTEVVLRAAEKGARLAQVAKYAQLGSGPMAPLGGAIAASEVRSVAPGIEVRGLLVERPGVRARGEATVIDTERYDLLQRHDPRVYEKDNPGTLADHDPEAGYTVQDWVSREPDPGLVVAAFNKSQGHGWEPNTMTVADGRLLMKPRGVRGMLQPVYEPPQGEYWVLSLDRGRPGVFEMRLDAEGLPVGPLPVRDGFAGPILLKDGKRMTERLRFERRPSVSGVDIGWPANQPAALTAYGFDARGRLVIVQLAGDPNDVYNGEATLEDLLQALEGLGVRDAVLGGGSGDVQRYFRDEEVQVVRAEGRKGSRFQLVAEELEAGQSPGEGQRRIGEALLVVPRGAAVPRGARLSFLEGLFAAVVRWAQGLRMEWDLRSYRSTRDKEAFVRAYAGAQGAALEILLEKASDPDGLTREAVVSALGLNDRPEARAAVSARLEDPEWGVRFAAILATRRSSDGPRRPDIAENYRRILKSKGDAFVRTDALRELESLVGPTEALRSGLALADAQEDLYERRLIELLKQLPPSQAESIELYLDALDSASVGLRAAAAAELAVFGTSAAARPPAFMGPLAVFSAKRLSALTVPERSAWLTEYLAGPLRTYLASPKEAGEGEVVLWDSTRLESMVSLRDRIRVVEAMGRRGDGASASSALRVLLGELTAFLTKRVYDRHSIEISVETTAYFGDYGLAREALHGVERTMARESLSSLPRLHLEGLDRAMAEEAVRTKRLPLGSLPSGVRRFLEFLRDNDLQDIALIGGAGWNVFFHMEPNDYDVSVVKQLSDSERSRYQWTASAATPELIRYSRQRLELLAKALGREAADFELPGGDPAHPVFSDGKEIQYAGPIDTDGAAGAPKVLIKRVLVDRGSSQVFSSNTGASWLRIALGVDPSDPAYAKLYFLDYEDPDLNPITDLLNGWIRIVGDDNNFTMGDILRAIRLQYLNGGTIVSGQGQVLDEDDIARILKPEIALYEAAGQMPVPLAHMTYKILRDAPLERRGSIRESLDRLGFLDLAARTLTRQPERIGFPASDQPDSGARLAVSSSTAREEPFAQAAALAAQRVARAVELKREIDRQFKALGYVSSTPEGPLARADDWAGWLTDGAVFADEARVAASEDEWVRWWAAARAEIRGAFKTFVDAKLDKIAGRVLAGRSVRRTKRTDLSRYPEYGRTENARDAVLRAAESLDRLDERLLENFHVIRAYRYADPDDPASKLRQRWEPGFPVLRSELESDASLTYESARAALQRAASAELRAVLRGEGLWDALPAAARRGLESLALNAAQPSFFAELYIPSVFEKRFKDQQSQLLRLARAPEDHIPHQPAIRAALSVFVSDLVESGGRKDVNPAVSALYQKQLAQLTDPNYTMVLFFGDLASDTGALSVLSDAYQAAADAKVRAQVIAAYLRVLWRLYRAGSLAGRQEVIERWKAFAAVVERTRFAQADDPAARQKQYAITNWVSEASDYLSAHWASFARGDRITFAVEGAKKTEDMNFIHAMRWSRQDDAERGETEKDLLRLLRQAANRAILREIFNSFQVPAVRGEIYRRAAEGPAEGIAPRPEGARLAKARRGPDYAPEDRAEREEALRALIRSVNDGRMEIAWDQDKAGAPGGIGEVRARLRADEEILELPEGLAVRVFVEPVGEWTARFEHHLAYLTKPKKTPRLDMPPKLLPPPGSLGQIVVMASKASEPGAAAVQALQIKEVQQRLGYRNLPQRLRWRLDLWRDRAIESLSADILGRGIAVFANNRARSIFFRDEAEILRSYVEPYQRLGWLFDRPLVVDGILTTVTLDPRSEAVLRSVSGARLSLWKLFLSLFDRRSVSQRRLSDARAFVSEYLRERPDSPIAGILIFGSVAKGTARKDSDLDYLMIKKAGSEPGLSKEDLEFHRLFSARYAYVEHAPTMPALTLTADPAAEGSRFEANGITALFVPPQLLNPFAFDVRTPGAPFVTDWRVAAAGESARAKIETKIQDGIREAYLRRGGQDRRSFGARLPQRIWAWFSRALIRAARAVGWAAPDRFQELPAAALSLAQTAYGLERSMPEDTSHTMMRVRLKALGDKMAAAAPELNDADEVEAGLALFEAWRSLIEAEAIARSIISYSRDRDLVDFSEALMEIRVPQFEAFFERWGRLAAPAEAYKLHSRIAGEYLGDAVGFLAPDAVDAGIAEQRDRLTRILGRVHQGPSASLSSGELASRLEGWVFALGDAASELRFHPSLFVNVRLDLTRENGGILYKVSDRLEYLGSILRDAGARLANESAPSEADQIARSWAGIWESRRVRGPFEGTFDRYPPMIIDFVEQRLRPAMPPGGTGRLIDLGAGADLWVARKIKAAFPSARIQALDVLEVDPDRVQGAEGIEYRRAFAERTGLEDDIFDAAISTFGVDYADRERVFGEVFRILKPGGRAVLVLHDPRSMFVGDIDARMSSTLRAIEFYRSMKALLSRGDLDTVNWQMRGILKRFYDPAKPEEAQADLDRRIAAFESDITNYRRVKSNLFEDRESLGSFLSAIGFRVLEVGPVGDGLSDSSRPMAYGVVLEKPRPDADAYDEHPVRGARLASAAPVHRMFSEASALAVRLRATTAGPDQEAMQLASEWITRKIRLSPDGDPAKFADEIQAFSDEVLLPKGYLLELSPDYFSDRDDYLQFYRVERRQTRRAPGGEDIQVLYIRDLAPRPGQTEPPTLMGWNSSRNDYTVVLPENVREFVERRLAPLVLGTAPEAPPAPALTRSAEGLRTIRKAEELKSKLLRQAFPSFDRKLAQDMILERAVRHEMEHEARRRAAVAAGTNMPYDESLEEQTAYLFNLQDEGLNVRYSLFTVVSNALRWNTEHFWFILAELLGMPDLDKRTLFTRAEKESIMDRLKDLTDADDGVLLEKARAAYKRAGQRWASYYGVEGARLAVLERPIEEIRAAYDQLSSDEKERLLSALSEDVYTEFFEGPLAERLLELGLIQYGTMPLRIMSVLYPEFAEDGSPAARGARLAERRATLRGLLSDPRVRPEPVEVLELVRKGLSGEEVLQAWQDLRHQRPQMEKTIQEYDALTDYFYRAVAELRASFAGRTVLAAGRDAEPLYDLLKYLGAVGADVPEARLFPGSLSFWSRFRSYDADTKKSFFASFGITEQEILAGRRWVIVDSGFYGSIGKSVHQELAELYPDLPGGASALKEDILPIRVLSTGAYGPESPRPPYALQLAALEDDPAVLQRIGELFPKTWPKLASQTRLLGEDERRAFHHAIGAATQLLPHHHGPYDGLDARDGVPAAVSSVSGRIQQDVDFVFSMNPMVIHPAASLFLQGRLAARVLADQREGRLDRLLSARPQAARLAEPTTPEFLAGYLGQRKDLVTVEVGAGGSPFLHTVVKDSRDSGLLDFSDALVLNPTSLSRLGAEFGEDGKYPMTKLDTPFPRVFDPDFPLPTVAISRDPQIFGRADAVFANAPLLKSTSGRMFAAEIDHMSRPGAFVFVRLHSDDIYVPRLDHFLGDLRGRGFRLEAFHTRLPDGYPSTEYTESTSVPLIVLKREAPDPALDERLIAELSGHLRHSNYYVMLTAAAALGHYGPAKASSAADRIEDAAAAYPGRYRESVQAHLRGLAAYLRGPASTGARLASEEELIQSYSSAASGGKPDIREWVLQNIRDLREKTSAGAHRTVFYPASGADALRALLAYDADRVLAADSIDPKTEDLLSSLGVTPSVSEDQKGDLRIKTISFELEARQRQIIEVVGDARDVDVPAVLGVEKADVLHIYFPTGAGDLTAREVRDAELRAKYGDGWWKRREEEAPADPDQVLKPGFHPRLNAANLSKVASGGFLVIDEQPALYGAASPKELMELLGLEEIEIVARHPYQVRTSFYPAEQELKDFRKGVIYRKAAELAPEKLGAALALFGKASEALMIVRMLESGEFSYLQYLDSMLEEVRVSGEAAIAAGLDAPAVAAAVGSVGRLLSGRLDALRVLTAEFVKVYEAGDVEGLGLTRTSFGELRSERFPLVRGLLNSDGSPKPEHLPGLRGFLQASGAQGARLASQGPVRFDSPLHPAIDTSLLAGQGESLTSFEETYPSDWKKDLLGPAVRALQLPREYHHSAWELLYNALDRSRRSLLDTPSVRAEVRRFERGSGQRPLISLSVEQPRVSDADWQRLLDTREVFSRMGLEYLDDASGRAYRGEARGGLGFMNVAKLMRLTPTRLEYERTASGGVLTRLWIEQPATGARLAELAPRPFRLADVFDPEMPADLVQIVLVTDNTGTLTPGYDKPLAGEVLDNLLEFSRSADHHILVNSGDPFPALMGKTYGPFFGAARPEDLARYHLVADGGNSRAGLDASGKESYRVSTEAWPQAQRFDYARRLAVLFFDQIRLRQGPLAQLFADVDDERLELIRSEFMERLDRVGAEGSWGVAEKEGQVYRFHLLPADLEARVGETYIYDVGSKVSLDILNRLDAVPLDFTKAVLERFRETFGPNTGDFYTVSGPGYVDVTKTTKVRGVQATLQEQVLPKLDVSRPVLFVVMGDSSNDIPTFGLEMPPGMKAAMLPVFLSTDAAYAADLPAGVLVGRDQVRGGLEVLEYLNAMKGLKVSEVPVFEARAWTQGEGARLAAEPRDPKEDTAALGVQFVPGPGEPARSASFVDPAEEQPYPLLDGLKLPVESDWQTLEKVFEADPGLRTIFLRAILSKVIEREPISIQTQDRAGFFRREGERITLLDRATREPLSQDGVFAQFVPTSEELEAARRAPAVSRALTPSLQPGAASETTIADLLAERVRVADAVQAPLEAYLAASGASARLLSVTKSVDTFPYDASRPEAFDTYASNFLVSLLELSRTSAAAGVSFRFEGDPQKVERILGMPLAVQLVESGRILQTVPMDPLTGEEARQIRMTAEPARGPKLPYLPEAPVSPGEVANFKAFLLLAIFAGRTDPESPSEPFLGAYRTVLGEQASAGLSDRVVSRFLSGDVTSEALALAARYALKPIQAIEWTQLVQFYRNVQRMVQRSA